jgi:taurine dioxygenase
VTSLDIRPLQDNLSFGVRIRGVTQELLQDAAVRNELNDLFESRGMIVFEAVEPSSQMHVALSTVFGPLKEHPVPSITRVDQQTMPGVIDLHCKPGEGSVVEIAGKRMSHWIPWHFDHCYNNELNRAGVLRAIEIVPEGGMTGFADGIDLYRTLSPELRNRIEGKNIIYRLNLLYAELRFGKLAGFVDIVPKPWGRAMNDSAKKMPRALHPAVWTRGSGEKVLHVSPWMAEGIDGQEDQSGDALLEAVCQEINAKAQAYYHKWQLTDMLIWDNWRMLHSVTGADPGFGRRMQRTTIKGDYGLGSFENGGVGGAILEMTV